MLFIKRIIVKACAKNYKKNKFKFVEVIWKKVLTFFRIRCRLSAKMCKCCIAPALRPVAYLGFGKGGHGERAERKPITGIWGRSLHHGPGAEPLVGGQGQSHPEAETVLAIGRLMEAAKLPIFLKFGNAENHRNLRCFAKNKVNQTAKRRHGLV